MKLRGSLRSLMTTVALTVALSVLAVPAFAAAPEIDFSAVELVFSGVSGKTTVPDQIMTIRNTGTSALTVSSITLTGTDAADYSLVSAPATPLNIAAGGSQAVTVRFAPRNTENGVQIASLRVLSNDADEATVNLGLYGLSAIGLEGGKEPSLNRVVTTLGYAINVGGTGLILGTSPNPIGDEVLMPLMQKASPGLVTLRPAARFSPHMLLPYGYYLPNGSNPDRHQLAIESENLPYSQQYPPNHQTLNPRVEAGGATTFDPGNASFGIFVQGINGRLSYTEDQLNATNPILHNARIYPLKNRSGQLIPNTYMVAFEDASNGDYQDYVYVISNVKVPSATPPGVELITNGSMETDANSDNLPDGWTFETLTGDTRVCGGGVAFAGNCAWKFVGGGNGGTENPLLQQTLNTMPTGLGAGDTLSFSMYTKASSGVTGRIMVEVTYTNTSLGLDTIDLSPTASTSYKNVTGSISLRGAVKKIRTFVRHRSTSASVQLWVDAVSLQWQDSSGFNGTDLVALPGSQSQSTIALPSTGQGTGTLSPAQPQPALQTQPGQTIPLPLAP